MKAPSKLFLLVPVLFGALCASSHGQITTSFTASTPGAGNPYFLPGTPTTKASGAISNSDADTYLAGDQTAKGEAFTTGNGMLGYSLNSFTLQQAKYSDANTYSNAYNGGSANIPFTIAVGQLSNGVKVGTPITATLTIDPGNGTTGLPDTNAGQYFTFNLTGLGITLLSNTQYYFEAAPANGNFFELNSRNTTSGGPVAGSYAFHGTANHTIDSSVVAENGNFAFEADLTAIPEPGAAAATLLGAAGLLLVIRRRKASVGIAG